MILCQGYCLVTQLWKVLHASTIRLIWCIKRKIIIIQSAIHHISVQHVKYIIYPVLSSNMIHLRIVHPK